MRPVLRLFRAAAVLLRVTAVLALLLGSAARTRAQDPAVPTRADSTRADSLRDVARLDARRAVLATEAPAPLSPDHTPARAPVLTFRGLLDAAPGTFTYRTDYLAGPDALSVRAASPAVLRVHWGPFEAGSLLTGAVLFDRLVPAWTDTVAMRGADVDAPLRAFDAPRPLTEVRYAQAGQAQLAEVVHAQARRRRSFGTDGVLRVMGGYAGRAGDGLFPNQRLTRGRTLMARAGFFGARGGVEALATHARGTYGASGGVLAADPSDPASIYDVFRSAPRDASARRFATRTDVALVGTRGSARVALVAAWEGLAYGRAPGDTLRGRVQRVGVRVTGPVAPLGVQTESDLYLDRGSEAFAGTALSARAVVGRRLGPADLRAGTAWIEGRAYPVVRALVQAEAGALRFEAAGGADALSPSAARRSGFGPYLNASNDPVLTTQDARASVTGVVGPATLRAEAFVQRNAGPEWTGAPGRDTLGAATTAATAFRTGVMAEARFRPEAPRGLYADVWAVFTPAPDATPRARSIPEAYGAARTGLRAALFQRDLVLDASARVRAWTAFASRSVHEPTGLLVLNAGPDVPAAATLDLVAEARVRTATLVLAYDNALAGTALLAGVQVLPGYPIPPQRLRLSVFWPIFD